MATTEEVIIDVKTEGTQQAEQQLDDVAKSTDELTESTDEYSKSLKENAKNVQFFGVSLNSLSAGYKSAIGGIRGAVTALKSFKVALAATGIGLLLVALGSLVTFLTKTQKGLDIVTRVTDQLSAAFTVIIDRIGLVGRAITKLFDGDFSGAWDDVKDSVTGLGAEIADVVEKAGVLSDAFAQLRDDQIANIETDARLRKELKEFNKEAENTNNTLEERAAFSAKAEAAEAKRIRNALALQAEEIRILEERQALGNNIAEDNRELAEARAESFRLEEESQERLTTQANKTNILRQQIIARDIAARDAAIQADIDQVTDELEREKAKSDAIIAIAKKQSAELEALTNDTLENQIAASIASAEADDAINAAKLQAEKDTAGQIAGISQSLARFQLDQAFAQIQASLAEALAKAFASLGPVGGAIASGLVLTAFGAIRSLLTSAVLPAVPQFEQGGMINGPSHRRGGVLIEAEGGEYIINRRAMRDPSVASAAEALNNVVPKYQFGGRVPDTTSSGAAIAAALSSIPRTIPVLYKETVDEVNNRLEYTEQAATL